MSRNYGGTMVANLFARFGADTEPFEKSMRSAVTRMLFAAESFTQAGRIMTTGITVPLAAVGVAALKAALKFDQSLTRMVSLAGQSAEAVEGFRDKILDIAQATGRSANDLGEAMYFIVSNGIEGAQALEVLDASARAAVVGLGETKDIAFATTSALNAYAQGSLSAEKAVAILVNTIKLGNIEADSLPPVLGQVLPVAAAMRLELDQVGASMAMMSRAGSSAKIAALGLKSLLISIIAPAPGAVKAAKNMGLSFEYLQEVVANSDTGLIDALRMMDEAVKATGGNLKSILPNQKAYISALQLMGENVETSIEVHEELAATVENDLQKAFEDAKKGPMQRYNDALANLNVALIRLGQNLYPLIENFVTITEKAADAAKWFNNLGDTSKGIITGFAGLLMALGPISYGLGNLFRLMSRYVGLSILFKASWVKNAAALMAGKTAAVEANIAFGTLGKTITSSIGFGSAAFLAGWEFGKILDNWLNITENFNKGLGNFKKTFEEIGSVYAKDTSRMNEAATAAFDLATKIGEITLAQQLEVAVKMNNTQVTSQLIDMINKQANAYNQAHNKLEGLTAAEKAEVDNQKRIDELKRQALEEEEKRLQQLREERDLMTSVEVKEGLEVMVSQYQDMVAQGIARNRINEQFADQMVDMLQWAKDYNLELPVGVQEMAKSMQEQGIPQWEEMEKLMERVAEHIDAQPGKIIEGMVKVGNTVATELRGGFHRGFAEGMDEWTTFDAQMRDALTSSLSGGFTKGFDKMREEIHKIVEETRRNPLEVGVIPNQEIWIKFFVDIATGKYPIA